MTLAFRLFDHLASKVLVNSMARRDWYRTVVFGEAVAWIGDVARLMWLDYIPPVNIVQGDIPVKNLFIAGIPVILRTTLEISCSSQSYGTPHYLWSANCGSSRTRIRTATEYGSLNRPNVIATQSSQPPSWATSLATNILINIVIHLVVITHPQWPQMNQLSQFLIFSHNIVLS